MIAPNALIFSKIFCFRRGEKAWRPSAAVIKQKTERNAQHRYDEGRPSEVASCHAVMQVVIALSALSMASVIYVILELDARSRVRIAAG